MPRKLAARPRLPEDRFTAPTMYFFSNSFLARSREIPCAKSSSMISWSCPSRFTCPSPNQEMRSEEARILANQKRKRKCSEDRSRAGVPHQTSRKFFHAKVAAVVRRSNEPREGDSSAKKRRGARAPLLI